MRLSLLKKSLESLETHRLKAFQSLVGVFDIFKKFYRNAKHDLN